MTEPEKKLPRWVAVLLAVAMAGVLVLMCVALTTGDPRMIEPGPFITP